MEKYFQACLLIILIFIFYAFLWVRIKEFVRYTTMVMKLPTYPHKWYFFGMELVSLSPVNIFHTIRKAALDYYPLFVLYLGPLRCIMIYNPDDAEAILATTAHNSKALFYKYMHLWLGKGLLVSFGQTWQTRRKILTPAFHFSILQQFVDIFNNESEVIVEKLIKGGNQSFIDLRSLVSEFTLSTINETSMGIKLNSNTEEGKNYINALHNIGRLYFFRVTSPWNVMNWFYYNFTTRGLNERKTVKILHNFTNKIIKEREETFEKFDIPSDNASHSKFSKKKLAFLDLLLNAKQKDGIINDQGIRDEVNTFMFEGHDTLAMSLMFSILLLAEHTNYQDEMYQEIVQKLDVDKKPNYNDLQELQFMERFIKESLRIYPSVPLVGRVLSEDVKTSVGVIPRGSHIYIHIIDIHRNPKISAFSYFRPSSDPLNLLSNKNISCKNVAKPRLVSSLKRCEIFNSARLWNDPERFDPDRFLPENSINRHPFQYLPFSAGPRNCIGQRFAILELKAALVGILRTFKIHAVDRLANLELTQDLVIRPAGPARVKFILREN